MENGPENHIYECYKDNNLHIQKQGECFHSVTRLKIGLYIHKRIHSVK